MKSCSWQHRPQAVDPPANTILEYESARAHEGICAMISGAEGERQYKYAKAAAGSKVLDVLLIPLSKINLIADIVGEVCGKNFKSCTN